MSQATFFFHIHRAEQTFYATAHYFQPAALGDFAPAIQDCIRTATRRLSGPELLNTKEQIIIWVEDELSRLFRTSFVETLQLDLSVNIVPTAAW